MTEKSKSDGINREDVRSAHLSTASSQAPVTSAADAPTLEQAWAVINAANAARDAKKVEATRKLVGRFFKYRNSAGPDEKWWLYAMPTNVREYGFLSGLTFQRKSYNDAIEVELSGDLITLREGPAGTGWTEIGTMEFWDAAAEIREVLLERLSFRDTR